MKKYNLYIKKIKQLIVDLRKLPEEYSYLQDSANEMVAISKDLEKALTTNSQNKFELAIGLRDHLDNFINKINDNTDKEMFEGYRAMLEDLDSIF